MKRSRAGIGRLGALAAVGLALACASGNPHADLAFTVPEALREGFGPDRTMAGEEHLSNVRQLTFGGENAEAYWSFDDRYLIFQSTRGDLKCDQIFIMDVATGGVHQVTDAGRTTCPFFLPDSDRILFASTHAAGPDCPPVPNLTQGYVWPVYDAYEIYTAERDGTGLINITHSPGYDAEATVRQDGRIVFTSDRSGDLELWTMDEDGGNLQQITHQLGYDGGAFFSPDGSKLVWRASRLETPEEADEYRGLLQQGLVKPTHMELWIADADGSEARRLTDLGAASFAPFFTPDGQAVVFASNYRAPFPGRRFEIWKINVDGTGLEQVTRSRSFDCFPMFSWDGKRIAFSSNRFDAEPHETNLFVADWTP